MVWDAWTEFDSLSCHRESIHDWLQQNTSEYSVCHVCAPACMTACTTWKSLSSLLLTRRKLMGEDDGNKKRSVLKPWAIANICCLGKILNCLIPLRIRPGPRPFENDPAIQRAVEPKSSQWSYWDLLPNLLWSLMNIDERWSMNAWGIDSMIISHPLQLGELTGNQGPGWRKAFQTLGSLPVGEKGGVWGGGGGTDLQIFGFQMGVEEVQKNTVNYSKNCFLGSITRSQVAAKSAFYLHESHILSFLLFRGRWT